MRSIRLGALLLICLTIAGCVGGRGTAAQTAHPAATTHLASIVATPTPVGAGVDELLKSSDQATSAPATPTPVVTPTGPLSCVEQRLRALQQGKVLPTETCQ